MSEVEANLVYKTSSRTTYLNPVSKKTNKEKKPYKITTKTKKGKQSSIVAKSEIITGATWRRSMGR